MPAQLRVEGLDQGRDIGHFSERVKVIPDAAEGPGLDSTCPPIDQTYSPALIATLSRSHAMRPAKVSTDWS
jgi:hypothetical protein